MVLDADHLVLIFVVVNARGIPPNPKQMQSSPVLLICLHAQLPELDPEPQGPQANRSLGAGGVQKQDERAQSKLHCRHPKTCTEDPGLRPRGAQSCRARHPG